MTSATPTSNSPCRSCKTVAPRQQSQRGCRVGRTAADAGGNRQRLVKHEPACLQIRHTLAEQPRGLEHEVFGRLAAGCRKRPGDLELQFRPGRKRKAVGAIGECNHAFKVVISVDPPTRHAKGQIDLGATVFDQCRGFDNRFSSSTGRHSECKIRVSRAGVKSAALE
jgi:hypothetical protein